ncbi:MAG: hypothetical protein ISR77_08075 [Pirellulaceae bacterium]|nr:hypothetical protein [Pirellulaceae bacterium]
MANSSVTREQLTRLKDAAIACIDTASTLSANRCTEIRMAREQGNETQVAETVDTMLRDAIDRWEQWGELLTQDATDFLQLHNADSADPVKINGTVYTTASEAAGALLDPVLSTFNTLVDVGDPTNDEAAAVAEATKAGTVATRRCCARLAVERVKHDVDFADRIADLWSDETEDIDAQALRVAVESEWAQASRAIYDGKAPSTLEAVCGGLTDGMERIVRFLWGRRYPTKWDALAESCWSGGEAADSAITKQLQRLTERLLENSITDVFLDVDIDRRSVKVVRPRLIDE